MEGKYVGYSRPYLEANAPDISADINSWSLLLRHSQFHDLVETARPHAVGCASELNRLVTK